MKAINQEEYLNDLIDNSVIMEEQKKIYEQYNNSKS